jgi:hypothetical protein
VTGNFTVVEGVATSDAIVLWRNCGAAAP